MEGYLNMSSDTTISKESGTARQVPISVLDLAPVNVGTTPADSFPKHLILPVMPRSSAITAIGLPSIIICPV